MFHINFWSDLKEDTLAYLAIVLIIVSLFVLRPTVHKRIESISGRVRQVKTDSFLHTLKTIGLTFFLASNWPIILFLFQWNR